MLGGLVGERLLKRPAKPVLSPVAGTPGSGRSGGDGGGAEPSARTAGSQSTDRKGRSARSFFSGRSTQKVTVRKQIVRQFEENKKAANPFAKIRSKLVSAARGSEELQCIDELADADADDDDDFKDVADDLCLSADPQVIELGDPVILDLKRRGLLQVDDEDILVRLKRHKSRFGKALFEAENYNNVGVELYSFGDVKTALSYFLRSLECCAQKKKAPAAQVSSEFKAFIKQQYNGDVQAFYNSLSDGEWRLSLGRRRFVNQMKKIGFAGDPERLFDMLDFNGSDGKATISEINILLQTNGEGFSRMDNETLHKGIILCNIGACHVRQGEPIVGLQRFREALKIIQPVIGDDDEDLVVARLLSNIAVAYICLDDPDAAVNYLGQVFGRHEAKHGESHPEVLQHVLYLSGYCFLVKGNRFNIIYDQNRMDGRAQDNAVEVNYNLAQCAFKERLRMQEALLEQLNEEQRKLSSELEGQCNARIDKLRLDIAQSHEIIAEIHDMRGEFDRAVPHLWEAIFHKEAVLNELDPDLLSSRNVIASLLMRSGRFHEALEAMEKAVTATAELFGEPSLALATEVLHMGLILFRMACKQQYTMDPSIADTNFALAIQKVNEAKDMQAELLGAEDLEFASTLQLLGNICLAAGHRRDARRHFEEALLIRVAKAGRRDVGTASSAHALGTLYARLPRCQADAVLLLRKACLVREARLGVDSLYLAESLHELGSVLLNGGKRSDHELALQHLSRAAQIREKRLGKESLKYAASLHQVGQAHAHMGLFSDASLYLKAALALRERLAPPVSAQIAMTKLALGIVLYKLGDFRAAMKLLRAAYSLRERMNSPEHPQTAACLHHIGVAYFKQGESQTALTFLQRALETRKQLNSADVVSREEDSDEDARDLSPKASPREKRTASMRKARRKLIDQKQKHTKASERTSVQGGYQENVPGEAVPQDGSPSGAEGENGRPSRNFASMLSRMHSKSLSMRSKSFAMHSDASEKTGMNSMPSTPIAGTSSMHAALSKREAEIDSDDSNVCMRDLGIDRRGWYAGSIGVTMLALGIVHMDLQDYDAARKSLRQAVCIHEEVFGSVSAEFGEALHVYGVLNRNNNQIVPALKYFQQSMHVREKACGYTHESTAESCIAVGEVMSLLGQKEESSLFLQRGIGMRESLFGPNDAEVKSLKEKWGKLTANSMQYDPVKQGEALPHFARRSPESLLHSIAQREHVEYVEPDE